MFWTKLTDVPPSRPVCEISASRITSLNSDSRTLLLAVRRSTATSTDRARSGRSSGFGDDSVLPVVIA